jgi:thiol-disulfide isomerase/thioredoxin
MITLLQASRRSLLVILPAFALLFAGCAKEAEETSSAGSSTDKPEIAEADGDSTGEDVTSVSNDAAGTKDSDDETAASPDLPPLIIPDTPNIPVAGSENTDTVASHGAWITDFALAKERAAAENKSILMDFTGSDWCGWCIRLHEEVFDFPEFQEYAEENLILLELDFPRGKRLPAELVAQNEELQERFAVEGFPTILMLDAEGRPFGRTGYQAGGPAAYVKHLAEMLDVRTARDEALAAAEKAEGLEKAKHLGEAISALPEDVLFPSYRPIIDEIVALDAKDEAGLKTKFGGLILQQQLDVKLADIQNLIRRSNDEEEILAEFAKLETEFAEYQAGLVEIKLLKGQVYSAYGKFEEVLALATELDQIKDLGEEERFMLLGMKVSAHDQAGRPEKGLEVIDGAVAETKEAQMLMQLYLTKGQLLLKMEKTEEAKAAFTLAVEKAPEDIKPQVEQYVKRLIPETPAGTESKPKTGEATEKPATEKPATEKPATEKPATEEKPAAEAAKPAEKDSTEKEKPAEPEAK